MDGAETRPTESAASESLRDGTWAPGVRRAVWARGVRAVVQFGVESSVLCPVLGQAMWRMGR